MRSMRSMRVLVAATALAGLMAVPADAQPVDNRTRFTFSGPVALPGIILPAGDYVFKLASTDTSRVVHVLSGDGRRSFGFFFALPVERPDPAERPELRFAETPPDRAPVAHTWWHPGSRYGLEFMRSRRPPGAPRQATAGAATSIADVDASDAGPAR